MVAGVAWLQVWQDHQDFDFKRKVWHVRTACHVLQVSPIEGWTKLLDLWLEFLGPKAGGFVGVAG